MQRFILLLIGLSAPALFAEESLKGNKLEDYLQRALSANPDLQQFEHRYQAAKQRIPQMSALPDPMLQVTHFVEPIQTRTGPQENAVVFNQRIPWFGKIKHREWAASAEAEALWFAYQNRQLRLVREVSTLFYEYAYLQQALHITRENLALLKSIEPIAETRVKAGASLNSLLRLKVEIGKTDDRLQSLAQKQVALSATLKAMLALPEGDLLPWPMVDETQLLSLNPEKLQADLLRENPALHMLEQKIISAEARKTLADLERYPDVVLGVNYMQIGDSEMSPPPMDSGQDAWGVTAGISIPLWWNKNKATRAEAQENLNASEQELRQKQNMLKAELTASLTLLNDAQRRLILYGDDLLDLAQQSVDNSFRAYEVDQTGILEVIDSERSLLELQLLYWRAVSDAWQQRIRIQTLVNHPLDGVNL
ncbi:TolC family protein [Kiritimatiellota bacterium B12222]|nr:TolC family protein [Kiritimatiellota bacterium B12222]